MGIAKNHRAALAALCLILLSLTWPQRTGAIAPTPGAEVFRRQWALERINAPCAWKRTTGAAAVTVAVVDSGVDMGHPDLVSRLRDDGYDFLDGDSDPRDTDGHGTHVAGIIAATLSSAEGVIGLAPGVKILPVRVLDNQGGDDHNIAAGISYAAEKGARVLNLSLGASLLLTASEGSPEIDAALAKATAAGVLIVVAAGNDYLPLPNVIGYENPNVMVVAASNRDDQRSRFSNYGAWISVVAPGEDILSTLPTYDVFLTSGLPPDERFNKNYDTLSGTSMAAPYVAALAALIFSAAPNATAREVRQVIERSADPSIYDSASSNVKRLRQLGAGRIDACAALQALTNSGAGTPANPTPSLPAGTAPATTTPLPAGTAPTQATSATAISIGPRTATPGSAATASLTRTVVVWPPQIPGVPTIDTTAQANVTPRPTRTLQPLPSGQRPEQVATLFFEALRAGDLQRAQSLAAPARLGGQVKLDLASFIDLSAYFERVGPITYTVTHEDATTTEVQATYDLAPANGQGGTPLTTTGTLVMVRDGDQWLVLSFKLPGLDR